MAAAGSSVTLTGSRRLSREDWLARALEALAEKGNAKLTIDSLVESLGVTKGSFYWHFENRADFVRSLLEYWHQKFTARAAEVIGPLEGEASERLFALMDLLYRENLAKYDVAIRAWAAQDAEVAEFVKKVDEFRIDFVRSLFADMAFTGRELEMRTRTFVCFYSMEHAMLARESKKERYELLKLRHRLLTRP